MNRRIEELLGSFWVKIPDQLSRVFDVAEHHRDLLAFAFQGTARGEDFLGEMLWGVGEGWLFLPPYRG